MPSFFREGEHYFISYITGPAHVLLGLAVARGGDARDVLMVRWQAVGRCGCGPVDEKRVREEVLAGIAAANKSVGSDWRPIEIVYVENDSPRYSLYEHCAKTLVERIDRGWG
jgi:hypothetical protein